MTPPTVSGEEARAAIEGFLALYEQARAEGESLRDHYREEGERFWEDATERQLRWLRSRRDLVLDGLLLPGGPSAFGMSRILSEFDHPESGLPFDRAARAFERYWADGLGLRGWDWRTGVPPAWAAAAAEARALSR
jgi:hypothetical protein